MKGRKLGTLANLICCFMVIIIYLIVINVFGDLKKNHTVFLNLYLVVGMVVLAVSLLSREINPLIPDFVIVVVYSVLCVISLFVNGSNNMLFQLMMLSMGAVSLLMRKPAFVLSLLLDIILAYLLWVIPIPDIESVYSRGGYFINVFALLVEFLVLYVIQSAIYSKEVIQEESTKTVEELIKVIAAKREEALEANHAKSDFLANMSHEIRTPINAVLGFNEMILRENTNPSITDFALDIRSSGNSLLSLVNDILDFSKIEAGKMEILPVTYDLSSMLNDLINIISFRAQEKGLAFRVDADPAIPHILYGDEVRIKQVITNILTNAVKYTFDGYIDLVVDFAQIDDYQIELYVRVSDTGQGIKEEDIEKLFLPFERVNEMKNRKVEGTGLGIPLTCTLLKLMGSKLEIDSTYGVGSTFSFALRQEVESWEPMGALDEAIKRVKTASSHEHKYFKAPAARILAVDDIPINLKVFESLLKRTEIRIDTASSGLEALSMMRKTKYDIIFLDHMMPEMDGIETLERMQGDRFNVNRFETPVIALTANAVSGARELYIEKGFEDYITKPIDSQRLESVMLRYLDPSLVTMTEEAEEESAPAPGPVKVAAAPAPEQDDTSIIGALRRHTELDVEKGIEASGGEDIYESVVKDYYETIDQYSKRIEDFYNARDLDNYRIQVHALKSTSRLAGAMTVSNLARDLERAADAQDADFIKNNTADLLRMYRDLKQSLAVVFGADEDAEDDRPVIEDAMLKEAFMTMKEGVDLFDQDLIESVMSELENYRMPDGFDDIMDRLRSCLLDVDMDGVSAVLDQAIGEK